MQLGIKQPVFLTRGFKALICHRAMTVAKRAAQVGGVDKFPGNVRGDMLSAFGNLQKKCNKNKEPTLM